MPTAAEKRATFRKLARGRMLRHPQSLGRRQRALSARLSASRRWPPPARAYAFAQGLPDGARVRATMMLAHLRELVAATDVPVNADFEGGFADDARGRRRERDAVRRDRRCRPVDRGFDRRRPPMPLYDFDLAVARVHAARAAIDQAGGDVVFTGRSEGFIRGRPISTRPSAGSRPIAAAGADCLYAPGHQDARADRGGGEGGGAEAGQFPDGGATGFTVNDLADAGRAPHQRRRHARARRPGPRFDPHRARHRRRTASSTASTG